MKHVVKNLPVFSFLVFSFLAYSNFSYAGTESNDDIDKCSKIFSSKDVDFSPDTREVDNLMSFLTRMDSSIGELFDQDVGVEDGYTLREHIWYMFVHYKMYFSGLGDSVLRLMALVTVLHDIGKPLSAVVGRNDIQTQYTMTVITSFNIMDNLIASSKINLQQSRLAMLMITGGLGDYFKGNISLEEVSSGIRDKASLMGMDPCSFLFLLTIYYQCDAGAYTHEVGANPRLEHLFSYETKDRKSFLEDSSRIEFAPKLEKMYQELENKLECK